MAKVISLFESQADVTRALDTLYSGDYGNIQIEVIENAGELESGATGVVAPAVNYNTGVTGGIGIPARLDDVDFASDEEAAWFAEGVRGGSVLVVADVSDESASAVKEVLRNHGGRTYEKE